MSYEEKKKNCYLNNFNFGLCSIARDKMIIVFIVLFA